MFCTNESQILNLGECSGSVGLEWEKESKSEKIRKLFTWVYVVCVFVEDGTP